MKKIRNLVLFFALIMVLTGVNVYAATVGDKLENPEAGWQRIDDRDSLIKYSGEISQMESDNYYENTQTYLNNNGKIQFKFKGTKLRIITPRYIERSSNTKIVIDGNIETYSEYGSIVYFCLVYEKLDLEDAVHTVEIYQPNNETIGLDAIDIDGELLEYLEEPSNLMAVAQETSIQLTWDEVTTADRYTILKSTTSSTIDTVIATNITETTYIDTNVEPGETYYYVVRAVKGDLVSDDSNIASAMIENTNVATLQIKLSTTDIYEYRLTMNQVDKFMNWYIDRADGTGLPFYKFATDSKTDPYKDSNEYLIFDKIVWFKVKEYLQ